MPMNAQDAIMCIQQIQAENIRLKEEIARLKSSMIDASRFYAAALTVEAVAALHGVHPETVRKYVGLGLIDKHPDSSDAKILIRASDALLLNFKELKRKSRIQM